MAANNIGFLKQRVLVPKHEVHSAYRRHQSSNPSQTLGYTLNDAS